MLVCQPNELRSNIRVAGGIIRSGRLTDHSLPFEEVDAELLDASGNGNVGTLLSGRHITTNGVSDYVSFPSLAAYNLAGVTRKITFWVKVSAWAGSGSQYLLGRGGVSSGGWVVAHESAASSLGFLSKQSGSSSNYSLVRFPRPSAGVWNYVELTVTNAVLTAASVNGVSQTLTTAVAPTGSYGDTAVALTIGQSVSSGYFAGSIADVQLLDGTTKILRARLNEHADLLAAGLSGLPAFDSSSNENHGSYVGCTGENVEGIPAAFRGLGDYEDYMWFDGVNDNVTTIPIGYTLNYSTGDWVISYNFIRTNALFTPLVNFGDNWGIDIAPDGGIGVRFGGYTPGMNSAGFNTNLLNNVKYNLRVQKNGNDISVFIDDVLFSTISITTPGTSSLSSFRMTGSYGTAKFFAGLVTELKINNTLIAEGNGVTSAAWGGGTVSGSPVTIGDKRRTIPQSSSIGWNNASGVLVPEVGNTGLDAQGNAISVPRPTTSTFNGFGEGETFTVAPGSGKSLFLWVYWDGATAVTYLTNGSWSLAVSALGALTATSGTTYVDGAAGSTLSTGWNYVGISHGSDIAFGTLTATGRLDRLTVYAQQLTASQQAQNYRATRSNYP